MPALPRQNSTLSLPMDGLVLNTHGSSSTPYRYLRSLYPSCKLNLKQKRWMSQTDTNLLQHTKLRRHQHRVLQCYDRKVHISNIPQPWSHPSCWIQWNLTRTILHHSERHTECSQIYQQRKHGRLSSRTRLTR